MGKIKKGDYVEFIEKITSWPYSGATGSYLVTRVLHSRGDIWLEGVPGDSDPTAPFDLAAVRWSKSGMFKKILKELYGE